MCWVPRSSTAGRYTRELGRGEWGQAIVEMLSGLVQEIGRCEMLCEEWDSLHRLMWWQLQCACVTSNEPRSSCPVYVRHCFFARGVHLPTHRPGATGHVWLSLLAWLPRL